MDNLDNEKLLKLYEPICDREFIIKKILLNELKTKTSVQKEMNKLIFLSELKKYSFIINDILEDNDWFDKSNKQRFICKDDYIYNTIKTSDRNNKDLLQFILYFGEYINNSNIKIKFDIRDIDTENRLEDLNLCWIIIRIII